MRDLLRSPTVIRVCLGSVPGRFSGKGNEEITLTHGTEWVENTFGDGDLSRGGQGEGDLYTRLGAYRK